MAVRTESGLWNHLPEKRRKNGKGYGKSDFHQRYPFFVFVGNGGNIFGPDKGLDAQCFKAAHAFAHPHLFGCGPDPDPFLGRRPELSFQADRRGSGGGRSLFHVCPGIRRVFLGRESEIDRPDKEYFKNTHSWSHMRSGWRSLFQNHLICPHSSVFTSCAGSEIMLAFRSF